MQWHHVKVHASAEKLSREEQLAWKIAEVAADPAGVESVVAEMIANRVIDNAAVAIAAINRRPAVSARAMALAHPQKNGGTIFGIESGVDDRFFQIIAMHAGKQIGVDDVVRRRLDNRLPISIVHIRFLGCQLTRADVGEIRAHR